jgi:hypothetical protein
MLKTLVLYVFHDFNDRVNNFINKCIFYDEFVDFIVISNNKKIHNNFKVPDYVKVLFRDNIGYDFGGWSDALLNNNIYKNYNYFIFVNSSTIGPFISTDFKDSKNKWTDIYISGLQNNIKLFGSTINTICNPLSDSHVQTYIFSMDVITLQYLIDCKIFNDKEYTKTLQETVNNKEILMSRKIIEKGWNIGSLFRYYKDVDFTFKDKKPNEYNITFLNDIMYNNYRKKLWDEYELVFIKGNRVNIKLIN